MPATADEKRYTGQRLQKSGVDAAVIEQFQTAWRAIRVAPALVSATIGPRPVVDPEPPPPEPRVDEWLAAFSEGDDVGIELARAALDEMFEERHPPVALTWWAAVTVDALPPWQRRRDIDWALVQFGTTLRKHGEQVSMGGMWRALAVAEPSAVLQVASGRIAFGFGRSAFLDLLLEVLIERAREEPALMDTLANALTPDMPVDVINIARELLNELRSRASSHWGCGQPYRMLRPGRAALCGYDFL